jgi:hypothetical protein
MAAVKMTLNIGMPSPLVGLVYKLARLKKLQISSAQHPECSEGFLHAMVLP